MEFGVAVGESSMLLLSVLSVVILLQYSSVESRNLDGVDIGESLHSLSVLSALYSESLAPVEIRVNHTGDRKSV